jgi:hypothetical protein
LADVVDAGEVADLAYGLQFGGLAGAFEVVFELKLLSK